MYSSCVASDARAGAAREVSGPPTTYPNRTSDPLRPRQDHCHSHAAARTRAGPESDASRQPAAGTCRVNAGHADTFGAASLARYDGDRTLRDVQRIGKHLDQFLVRRAFDGWRIEADEQGAVASAGEPRAAGARDDSHGDDDALRGRFDHAEAGHDDRIRAYGSG